VSSPLPGEPERSPPPPGPWQDASAWTAPADGGAPPLEPPRSIRIAVRLMVAGAVLSTLGIFVTFMQRDEIRDQLSDADPNLTADELDTAVNVAIAANVMVSVLVIGLWLWMAWANNRGRRWARTVATVLGVLNVLFTVMSFGVGQLAPLAVASGVVSVALAVVILTLLYREDSSSYYDAMTA
jgi:hypothetical protein